MPSTPEMGVLVNSTCLFSCIDSWSGETRLRDSWRRAWVWRALTSSMALPFDAFIVEWASLCGPLWIQCIVMLWTWGLCLALGCCSGFSCVFCFPAVRKWAPLLYQAFLPWSPCLGASWPWIIPQHRSQINLLSFQFQVSSIYVPAVRQLTDKTFICNFKILFQIITRKERWELKYNTGFCLFYFQEVQALPSDPLRPRQNSVELIHYLPM